MRWSGEEVRFRKLCVSSGISVLRTQSARSRTIGLTPRVSRFRNWSLCLTSLGDRLTPRSRVFGCLIRCGESFGFGFENGRPLDLRNLRGMPIAMYSFCIRFCSAKHFHEFPHKCFYLDASPMVGSIDHFRPRDRGNMSTGFRRRGGASQTCGTEQEERIAVAS